MDNKRMNRRIDRAVNPRLFSPLSFYMCDMSFLPIKVILATYWPSPYHPSNDTFWEMVCLIFWWGLAGIIAFIPLAIISVLAVVIIAKLNE